MKARRVLSVMTASVLLLVFVLAGCGATDSEEGGTGTSASALPDASASASEQSGESAAGLPIVKEPITLNFVFSSQQLTKDLGDLPMFADLEKNTNIHINWDIVRSGWDDKKAMLLASGDLPDAFFGQGLTDADITTNVKSFIPLEDYINKYAPNIKSMFDEYPDTGRMSTFPDGYIYSLPHVMPLRPSCNDLFMINKTWLDKLGLKTPTTLDEFYAVLKAFKNGDPNGNNKNDEVPFNWSPLWEWFNAKIFIGAYGVEYGMTDDNLIVQSGKVSFMPAMNEYKELVGFLNKLYSEDLVYKEVFTQDFTKWLSLGKNPDAPILGATLGWTAETMMGDWASQYEVIAPLKSAEGVKPLWGTNKNLVKYGTNYFAITTKNKYPVETVRWIDQCYTPDMSMQLYFGSFGIGVNKNTDGSYEVLKPSDPKVDQDTWKWTNAPGDFAPESVSKKVEDAIKAPAFYADRINVGKIYDQYLLPDKDVYPAVKYTKEVGDELTLMKTDISKYVNQKWAQWITNGGIDNEWDGYVKELEKMGLSRMMEIYQQGYDNYYK